MPRCYRRAMPRCYPARFTLEVVCEDVVGVSADVQWIAIARSGRLGDLDERLPIPAVRAADFPDDEMIAGIHGADLDFLVRKDHDDAVLDVDDHLPVDVHA